LLDSLLQENNVEDEVINIGDICDGK